MKIPNRRSRIRGLQISLARIVSEDSQLSVRVLLRLIKSSKDS